MSDLISRKAAIDAMAELQGRASTKAELKGISKAWKRIKKLPSAEPVRYGKWIDSELAKWDGGTYYFIQCSHCGHERDDCDHRKDTPFCPECGAYMLKPVTTRDYESLEKQHPPRLGTVCIVRENDDSN